jgi:hypothetical protein
MPEQPKKRILRTIVVFLISYVFFLLLWIQVKNLYAEGITAFASKIAARLTDSRFEEMTREKDLIEVSFSPVRKSGMLIDIPINTSSYTFNAPLTFSIMTALYFYIKRKLRAYSEALLILAVAHLLYVFTLETKLLTEVIAEHGIGTTGMPFGALPIIWLYDSNPS